MIQREKKRERLVNKHINKREAIKEELKTVSSFQERLALYKKFEKIPRKLYIFGHNNDAFQLDMAVLSVLKLGHSLKTIFSINPPNIKTCTVLNKPFFTNKIFTALFIAPRIKRNVQQPYYCTNTNFDKSRASLETDCRKTLIKKSRGIDIIESFSLVYGFGR